MFGGHDRSLKLNDGWASFVLPNTNAHLQLLIKTITAACLCHEQTVIVLDQSIDKQQANCWWQENTHWGSTLHSGASSSSIMLMCLSLDMRPQPEHTYRRHIGSAFTVIKSPTTWRETLFGKYTLASESTTHQYKYTTHPFLHLHIQCTWCTI